MKLSMPLIYKKVKDLVIGDKFTLYEEMLMWHRYNTVISINEENVYCEDLSYMGYWKPVFEKSDSETKCIIRPDAPLHLRKECYPYAKEYINWPYDYPDKEKIEKEVKESIQNFNNDNKL